MRTFRLAPIVALPLLIVACSTAPIAPTAPPSVVPSASPSAAPTAAPTAPPTATPTDLPTATPTAPPTPEPTAPPTAPTSTPTVEPSPEPTNGTGDLNPSLSDAGIVARVTLSGDSRGFDRDGTYDVIAVSDDGPYCSFTFDGDEYQAIAYDLSTDLEQVQRLSVTIPWDAIPESDGDTLGVEGRVSFDFNAESIFGMTYTGDASHEDEGSSTIDVDRAGQMVTFSFDSTTWDDATFSGQLVCATL
jgi:hypothetical protein